MDIRPTTAITTTGRHVGAPPPERRRAHMPVALGRRVSRLLVAYYRAPDHPTKLRLWRYLRRAMRHARLTAPYGRGGLITLDERDYLQHQILAHGAYEPEVWDSLARFAVGNESVWDVGGNIGSLAVQALLDDRVAHVQAFEPDPFHAAVLIHNLHLNGPRWTVHPLALSDTRQRRTFYHAGFPHSGGSTLLTDFGHGSFEVECSTADELVFERSIAPPTLLKIDVEGSEGPLLRGARRLLAERPPKAIAIEADSDPHGAIQTPEVVDELERAGYRLAWIRRPEGAIYHRENYLAILATLPGPHFEAGRHLPIRSAEAGIP